MRAWKIALVGNGIGIVISKSATLPSPTGPAAAHGTDGRADLELGKLALLSPTDERHPSDELARLGLLEMADDDGPPPHPIG
jgi:hypothetical protein